MWRWHIGMCFMPSVSVSPPGIWAVKKYQWRVTLLIKILHSSGHAVIFTSKARCCSQHGGAFYHHNLLCSQNEICFLFTNSGSCALADVVCESLELISEPKTRDHTDHKPDVVWGLKSIIFWIGYMLKLMVELTVPLGFLFIWFETSRSIGKNI